MDKSVQKIFGDRVRVRVSGICLDGENILLVNHRGLYGHNFWAPPGGGIEFGETASDRLNKEFLEETGLQIEVGRFLFACEFIKAPLHAIELFFEVQSAGSELLTGTDPELGGTGQIIKEVKYVSPLEISHLPSSDLHGLFKMAKTGKKILDLKGYLRI